MCGLVSILSTTAPVEPTRLKKAADSLAHRGPDGDGFWLSADGKVGLAHRRLSIIDLATGGQPISNEDETVHIIVNGEFYDFEDIRQDLIRKGHSFRTSSDSEIALHLYEQYGLDFVHHLTGEFALVIYDEKHKRLIAARDRFGIKPLSFAQETNGTLLIASEAKAIFAAGFGAAWDDYAFFHSCNVQYTPQDSTLFQGVSQLKPGHLLVCENGVMNISKYWDLDFAAEPVVDHKSDAQWIELFNHEFESAIKRRLRADVPICFHLSGGLDSSAVAATAAKLHGAPFDCFTVRFDNADYDEYPIAKNMAEHMGSNLHSVSVSQDDMVRYIPDAVYYSEGLAINGHLVGKFMLSRAIRAAGFKVALTGEGADEVLAGYPHFREDMMGSDATQRDALYASNDKLAGVFLAHGDTLPTDALTKAFGYLPSFLKAKASLGLRMTSILSSDFKADMRGHNIYQDVAASFDQAGQMQGRHVVNQSSYLWSKMALSNYILRTLGDGCEMANSIEGRLPFLDHNLFALLRAMPMHLKIRDLVEKFVLRQGARNVLTPEVYMRQKHPFIAPPVSRYSTPELDVFIQDNLRSTDFAKMRFFDRAKVMGWLDQLKAKSAPDRIAAEPVLMMLLTSFFIQQRFKLS